MKYRETVYRDRYGRVRRIEKQQHDWFAIGYFVVLVSLFVTFVIGAVWMVMGW